MLPLLLRVVMEYELVRFIVTSNSTGGAVYFVDVGAPIDLFVPNLTSSVAFVQNTTAMWYLDSNGTNLYQYDVVASVMLSKKTLYPTFQSQSLFLCYRGDLLYGF